MSKQQIWQTVKRFYIYAIRLNGRSTRADYFGLNLVGLFFAYFGWLYSNMIGIEIMMTLVTIIMFLPALAVGVRRLQDCNRKGYWVLWSFIPVVGWLILFYLCIQKGTKGTNQHGPDPRKNRKSVFQLYDTDLFKKP